MSIPFAWDRFFYSQDSRPIENSGIILSFFMSVAGTHELFEELSTTLVETNPDIPVQDKFNSEPYERSLSEEEMCNEKQET
ncbi:MAG: hypothetical protein KAR05_00015 [Candidatus Omnitrophica bacterium]|nr:hypothetical protein [Candidatus Omnitrophota bacterium]